MFLRVNIPYVKSLLVYPQMAQNSRWYQSNVYVILRSVLIICEIKLPLAFIYAFVNNKVVNSEQSG